MKIKKLQKCDLKNALELVWSVFQKFEAPDSPEHGVAHFKDYISYSSIVERFDKGELSFWGCFISGELTGIIATRGISHISLLFVKEEFHKQGIARQLFQTLAETYRRDKGIKKITVNSSPYAVEVYHHLGFTDTSTEQIRDGIRFTPMEFSLV
jgi:GNAT superfamily N-acetyltransferase